MLKSQNNRFYRVWSRNASGCLPSIRKMKRDVTWKLNVWEQMELGGLSARKGQG